MKPPAAFVEEDVAAVVVADPVLDPVPLLVLEALL